MNSEFETSISRDNRRTKAIVLAVVILMFLGLVAVGYFAIDNVFASSREAIAIGNKYLELSQKHDYSDARQLFTPGVEKNISIERIAQVQKIVETSHGRFISYGTPTWEYKIKNNSSSFQLIYPIKSTNGDSSITMSIVETGAGWKIYSYHFEF